MTHTAAADSHAPDGSHAWFRLGICMLLGTIGSVGMWAIVVILPAAQADFGVSRGEASLPYTLTMVGFAIGNVVIGRFVDRMGVVVPISVAAVISRSEARSTPNSPRAARMIMWTP